MAGIYFGDLIAASRQQVKLLRSIADARATEAEYNSRQYHQWGAMVNRLAEVLDLLGKARDHANREGLQLWDAAYTPTA